MRSEGFGHSLLTFVRILETALGASRKGLSGLIRKRWFHCP